MISLDFLSEKITEMLGSEKYQVYLNTNEFPNDNAKIPVSMTALRTPYGYTEEEFDAENLQITLTFDLTAESEVRDIALYDIQTKLLGWRNFLVEMPEKSYKVFALFEQQPPSTPYKDFGGITQQIVVSATAQVQCLDCEALVGNSVKVYINGVELLKVSKTSTLTIGTDNNIPLSNGITLPEVEGISQVPTKTLTFLYTGKEIEREFINMAEKGVEYINRVYDYEAYYKDFKVYAPIKILSVSVQDSAGVYLQYTLNVQVVYL